MLPGVFGEPEDATPRLLGRAAYVVAFLALAGGWYELLGAGPTPSEKPDSVAWWRPAGHALRLESEWLAPFQAIAADVEQARHEGRQEPRGLIPLLLFALPPAALTLLGFLLFRGAVARVLILALGLTLCGHQLLRLARSRDLAGLQLALAGGAALDLALRGALRPRALAGARGAPPASRRAARLRRGVRGLDLLPEHRGHRHEPDARSGTSRPWPALTLYGFLLAGLVRRGVAGRGRGGLLARGAGGAGRTAAARRWRRAALAAALHRIPVLDHGSGCQLAVRGAAGRAPRGRCRAAARRAARPRLRDGRAARPRRRRARPLAGRALPGGVSRRDRAARDRSASSATGRTTAPTRRSSRRSCRATCRRSRCRERAGSTRRTRRSSTPPSARASCSSSRASSGCSAPTARPTGRGAGGRGGSRADRGRGRPGGRRGRGAGSLLELREQAAEALVSAGRGERAWRRSNASTRS